jgi:hypothetical protein
MSVATEETRTFAVQNEDTSDGESIATSDSSDNASGSSDDDDSFVEPESPKKQKLVKQKSPEKKQPVYSFVQFNSDPHKTMRPFKETNDHTTFTVVAINRRVPQNEMHMFLGTNLDYSIVKSRSNNTYRALFCHEINTFAVLAATTFDNTAVQTILRKQTAVRKSVQICQYSLDTSLECPANFVKLAKKLDIANGGIVFSTVTAQMYLEKVKKDEPTAASKPKRKTLVEEAVVTLASVKKAKVDNDDSQVLLTMQSIAEKAVAAGIPLSKCTDFLEKAYNYADFTNTLAGLNGK